LTNIYLSRVFKFIGFDDSQQFLFLFVLGIAFFSIFIFSTVVRASTDYFMLRFQSGRNYSISRGLLHGYLCQPYEFFLDRNTSDLGKNILAEVDQVISRVMKPLMNLVAYGLLAIILLGLIFAVDPKPAFIVGALLGGSYGLIYLLVRNRTARLGRERWIANQLRFACASEALGGIKDVKILGRENEYLSRFKVPSLDYARIYASVEITSMMPRFFMQLLSFGGIMAVALYFLAVKNTLAGALPVLGMYAFAGYRLMPALQNVFQSFVSIRFGAPALNALHKEYMQRSAVAGSIPREEKRMIPKKKIALHQLTYRYPNAAKTALSGLDLEIPAGTTLGIVGLTGAGKTTLVDVILGLLRPQQGRIMVDDTEITIENLRLWQNTLGYVPQQVFLSDDTVAANIAFGLPGNKVDMARVVESAKAAKLDDFIENELPKGYNTIVGERGVRLSGGQRQRLSIARALYQRPEVLILDEATSALDNLTEREVMEAVHDLKGEMTIIMIAHRLSTVRVCDRIVLLENGQVASMGTYQELFVSNDHFRAMAEVAKA
jgi:ABC-type bacteriocin/lantibiotic exporter with double-glycine peptidase domain